jgi:hypothetical protein
MIFYTKDFQLNTEKFGHNGTSCPVGISILLPSLPTLDGSYEAIKSSDTEDIALWVTIS